MIPLDQSEKWIPLLKESAMKYLNESEQKTFFLISDEEAEMQLKEILEKPIHRFSIINEVYFRARWAEVMNLLHAQMNIKLLEIASGDADMIPQVMAHSHPHSTYITANMNKKLTNSLLDKTKDLELHVKVLEDDAMFIERYLKKDTVDIIAFQHSINDVIQGILCGREGIDTIYSDWMEVLPQMIGILQKEMKENSLEQHTKAPFLELMNGLITVLKKDGIIAMNHYMFQLDLDWGYPKDLFEDMVPMTREWLKELGGCREVFFEGFHPNWWIFLQKK